MPATYPAKSIFLEVEFFGDDRDEILLPCQAVTVDRDAILVPGVETRHLNAIRWIRDVLSQHDRPADLEAVVAVVSLEGIRNPPSSPFSEAPRRHEICRSGTVRPTCRP